MEKTYFCNIIKTDEDDGQIQLKFMSNQRISPTANHLKFYRQSLDDVT